MLFHDWFIFERRVGSLPRSQPGSDSSGLLSLRITFCFCFRICLLVSLYSFVARSPHTVVWGLDAWVLSGERFNPSYTWQIVTEVFRGA